MFKTAELQIRRDGIDFDKDVNVIRLNKDEYIYQYCLLDGNDNPIIGSYFYKNKNVNPERLGFDITNRKLIRMKINESVEFLESTAANINDWNNTSKIFQGGEIQLFNPTAKIKVTDITILK